MWDAAVDAAAGAAPGWLVLGVVLHLANQVARGRGWHSVIGAACGHVRRRDAVAAWVAGAGAGGVFSARGGDAVRVLLMARRQPDAGCSVLAGTVVAEGAGELAVGLLLLGVAILVGVGPELGAPPWMVVAGVAGLIVLFALALRLPRVRRVARGVASGCVALRDPRAYARGVLPWQMVSRVCRFGALACFLAAFGLPATPAAVLLVMFTQCSGRLLPFAPASVGASVAILAATFGPVTGTAVPTGQLAAFFLGTSTVLTVVGTVLSITICLRTARWRDLVETLRASRRRPAPAPAPARAV
jgi:uncharacterized membrane protein YbhN (UPF0104 family)